MPSTRISAPDPTIIRVRDYLYLLFHISTNKCQFCKLTCKITKYYGSCTGYIVFDSLADNFSDVTNFVAGSALLQFFLLLMVFKRTEKLYFYFTLSRPIWIRLDCEHGCLWFCCFCYCCWSWLQTNFSYFGQLAAFPVVYPTFLLVSIWRLFNRLPSLNSY